MAEASYLRPTLRGGEVLCDPLAKHSASDRFLRSLTVPVGNPAFDFDRQLSTAGTQVPGTVQTEAQCGVS